MREREREIGLLCPQPWRKKERDWLEALGNVMYARHGGFVEGAEFFDSGFFGMSAAEAKTIDPQQRLALEMSYAACHHAGRAKQSLLGSDTGVFVGQCFRNSSRHQP